MHFGMWQLRPEFQSQIRATDDWPSMAAFKGHLFQRVAAISRKWKEIGRFFFSLLRDFLSWALQKFRQNWNWTTQLRWILFERWVPGTSLRGPVIWLKFAVLREVSQAAEVQLTSRKTKRLWVFQPKLKHFFKWKNRVCSPIKIIEKKAKWSQLNWSKRETMKTEPFVCANKWPTKKSLGILCYWASRG